MFCFLTDKETSATTIFTLVYAVLAYRRIRKYDAYHQPPHVNVKHFGYADDDPEPHQSILLSSTRSRAKSTSSIKPGHASMASISASVVGTEQEPLSALDSSGETYSHQRDTLFDDYVGRRSLMLNRQSLADDDQSTHEISDSIIGRSASFVGRGEVRSARALEGGTLVRKKSEMVILGDLDDDIPEEPSPVVAYTDQEPSTHNVMSEQSNPQPQPDVHDTRERAASTTGEQGERHIV
jgi:hypothetical protein